MPLSLELLLPCTKQQLLWRKRHLTKLVCSKCYLVTEYHSKLTSSTFIADDTLRELHSVNKCTIPCIWLQGKTPFFHQSAYHFHDHFFILPQLSEILSLHVMRWHHSQRGSSSCLVFSLHVLEWALWWSLLICILIFYLPPFLFPSLFFYFSSLLQEFQDSFSGGIVFCAFISTSLSCAIVDGFVFL